MKATPATPEPLLPLLQNAVGALNALPVHAPLGFYASVHGKFFSVLAELLPEVLEVWKYEWGEGLHRNSYVAFRCGDSFLSVRAKKPEQFYQDHGGYVLEIMSEEQVVAMLGCEDAGGRARFFKKHVAIGAEDMLPEQRRS